MTPTVRKATPLKRVSRDASLHPATVQKIAAAKVVPFRQDRTRPRPPAAAVTSRTVDPRVWKTALRLAGGDVNRIQVLDYSEVRVVNHPRR